MRARKSLSLTPIASYFEHSSGVGNVTSKSNMHASPNHLPYVYQTAAMTLGGPWPMKPGNL